MSSQIRSNIKDVLCHIKSLGFAAKTIIDVGVAYGTPELYEAFPEARLILVDPLINLTDVRTRPSHRQVDYIVAAAASKVASGILNLHQDLVSSSLLPEEEGPHCDGSQYAIEITTIDQICAEMIIELPLAIKVDVQGFELEVLIGASNMLKKTDLVIAEVSLFHFYKGSPTIREILEYMESNVFALYDIVGQLYRPLDNALAQVDLVFVKDLGPLRTTHAFATTSQRATLLMGGRCK